MERQTPPELSVDAQRNTLWLVGTPIARRTNAKTSQSTSLEAGKVSVSGDIKCGKLCAGMFEASLEVEYISRWSQV